MTRHLKKQFKGMVNFDSQSEGRRHGNENGCMEHERYGIRHLVHRKQRERER